MRNKEEYYTDTLDFEVVKKPLFISMSEGNVIKYPKRVALVNDKTEDVLSLMSPSYRLFTNEEFMKLTEKISSSLGLKHDHYAIHQHGKRVLSAFRLEDEEYTLMGHRFKNNMVIYDSRDGSTCLSVGGVGTLYRCSNLFSSTNVALSIRHNKNLDAMVEELYRELEIYRILQVEYLEGIEKIADKEVSKENLYEFLGGWVKLSPREVKDIAIGNFDREKVSTRMSNIIEGMVTSWNIETKELGENGFGMYNTLTHYFTHNREKDERDLLFADFGRKEKQVLNFVEAL